MQAAPHVQSCHVHGYLMRVLITYNTLLQPTVQQHKQKHKHSSRCAPLTDRNLSECVCVCVRSLVSMVSRRHTHLCCMNRDKDTLDMYLHIHIYIYMYTCTHVLTKTDVRIKRMPRERERERQTERERERERERESGSLC